MRAGGTAMEQIDALNDQVNKQVGEFTSEAGQYLTFAWVTKSTESRS
jgi:hypothetical protein